MSDVIVAVGPVTGSIGQALARRGGAGKKDFLHACQLAER